LDCKVVERLLPGFLDGELDLIHHQRVEHHLAECPACGQSYQQLRSLQSSFAALPLYYNAPSSLRDKVEAIINTSAHEKRRVRPRLLGNNFINIAAAVLLLALVGSALFIHRSEKPAVDPTAEVLANHLRSLQVDHLTDLASSDPEAVKAWFIGKVNFSPEVVDLSDKEYRLAGARLDFLDQQVVAVVVYRSGPHVINLFVAPAKKGPQEACATLDVKGYRLRHWDAFGATYWAISDFDVKLFEQFIKELTEKIANVCEKRRPAVE
jgi:anti-sigma factor RsiW